MKNKSTEGIMYPQSYTTIPTQKETCNLPKTIVVPHKSWNLIKEELERKFASVANSKPKNIFVFAFLKNGKIGFDDSFTIYTDSDCEITNKVLTKDDDVCSEEYSAEILQPFFSTLFPQAKVSQFLTTEKNEENKVFFDYLWKEYPNSLFIISRNDSEDSVWPENLQD